MRVWVPGIERNWSHHFHNNCVTCYNGNNFGAHSSIGVNGFSLPIQNDRGALVVCVCVMAREGRE